MLGFSFTAVVNARLSSLFSLLFLPNEPALFRCLYDHAIIGCVDNVCTFNNNFFPLAMSISPRRNKCDSLICAQMIVSSTEIKLASMVRWFAGSDADSASRATTAPTAPPCLAASTVSRRHVLHEIIRTPLLFRYLRSTARLQLRQGLEGPVLLNS